MNRSFCFSFKSFVAFVLAFVLVFILGWSLRLIVNKIIYQKNKVRKYSPNCAFQRTHKCSVSIQKSAAFLFWWRFQSHLALYFIVSVRLSGWMWMLTFFLFRKNSNCSGKFSVDSRNISHFYMFHIIFSWSFNSHFHFFDDPHLYLVYKIFGYHVYSPHTLASKKKKEMPEF